MDLRLVEILAPVEVAERRRDVEQLLLRHELRLAAPPPLPNVVAARLGRLLVRAGSRLEQAARPRPLAPTWVPVADPCGGCGN